MKPIAEMTVPDLLAFVGSEIESEMVLGNVLYRAAVIAQDTMPALEMLFCVLSEEPSEIAAEWTEELDNLATRLHVDTDGPTLCRIVSRALAQFANDEP